jgi:hypothetical protein
MIGQRVKKKNRKTNSNTTITNHVTIHTLRKYQRFTGVFASGSTAFMSYLLPSEPTASANNQWSGGFVPTHLGCPHESLLDRNPPGFC